MRSVASVIATVGGLGRIPFFPGTIGSLVGLALGLLSVTTMGVAVSILVVLGVFPICCLLCSRAAALLRKTDPREIILDEVWGMWAVIVLVPNWTTSSVWLIVIAFLGFRTFDIMKPPPLRRLERWPAGWGIMADDLGAAIYTVLVLELAVALARVI